MTFYIGIDVSKEEANYCARDERGQVLWSGKTASEPNDLYKAITRQGKHPERCVLETGTLSNWLARCLRDLGLNIEVIDARHAHQVMNLQRNKTDANDASLLAEIARTGFFKSVSVCSETSQVSKMLLKARDHLVGQRRSTQNTVRGLLGSLGIRFPKHIKKLEEKVRFALAEHPELLAIIEPLLSNIDHIKKQISVMDQQINKQVKKCKICKVLMSIPGVGPVTSMAFTATIDDPYRFKKSRDVGAYVGLTAKRYQSGDMDWSGRISRQGNHMLRTLLYEAANSLMCVVRKAHPLKDWARRIAKRSCRKKAVTALARKLSVIMHKMMITGEFFRWPENSVKEITSI